MELTPKEPNDRGLQLRQMIQALTDAVQAEDMEFMLDVTSSQQLLRPFEIVEYMEIVRKGNEDPVENRRWTNAIYGYAKSLEGQEFPQEEVDAINTVLGHLQFDSIVANEETADEAHDVTPEDYEEEDNENWENTTFSYNMDPEEYERIITLPTFVMAQDYARGKSGYTIADAIRFIQNNVSAELGAKMRKILDPVIAQTAQEYAQGRSGYNIRDAKAHINKYASDEQSKALMQSCLDKHVFKLAEAYTQRKGGYSIKDAKAFIIEYASTPGRRDAMLRRLGFL